VRTKAHLTLLLKQGFGSQKLLKANRMWFISEETPYVECKYEYTLLFIPGTSMVYISIRMSEQQGWWKSVLETSLSAGKTSTL